MMGRTTVSVLVGVAALSCCVPGCASAVAVFDRIVATVNGHVILQSEWDEELGYEAVLTGRHLSGLTTDERKAVLDRLIDQELLGEQMATAIFSRASEQEAAARISEARHQSLAGTDENSWSLALAAFRITEKDLLAHVQRQMNLARLVDARLRPAVQIDAKSVEAYYREKFVPELKQAGSAEAALASVSDRIRDLLTEQKVNELLVSWLRTLRSEGEVNVRGRTSEAEQETR